MKITAELNFDHLRETLENMSHGEATDHACTETDEDLRKFCEEKYRLMPIK